MEANVFSDGSLKLPRCPEFALGGAGVWAVGPNPGTVPLDASVFDYAYYRWHEGNLELWAALAGPAATSTRSEVLPLAIATLLPYPVRIALDSKHAVECFEW
eukprot:11670248-Alexandrium_andersonii.AAC.1